MEINIQNINLFSEEYVWIKQLAAVYNKKKDKLSDKERKIMDDYDLVEEDKKKTQRAIGVDLGVTHGDVSGCRKKVLEKWRKNKNLKKFFEELELSGK